MKEMLNEWKRFLNEETYYHGGGKDFLPTRIGTFYSKDRSYAEKYAKHHKEGEVFEVGIDLSQANVYPKTFWWQEFQEIWKPEEMFKGYDAVKVIEPNGEDPSIVVLNPSLVKKKWNKFISEEKEVIMFPARFLKSHMGEYRTEIKWKNFLKLGDEEKRKWAETVDLKSEPVEITVFMDGGFGFGDGHHRVMAGKILDVDIPIIITHNHIENKAQPGTWEAWWKEVSKGNSPAQLNPEEYNLRSPEQVKELIKK